MGGNRLALRTQNLWDYWAKFYNQLWVQKWSLGPTRSMIIDHIRRLPETDGKRDILDMGCGTGQLLQQLKAEYSDDKAVFTGVDYSAKMISTAIAENPDINYFHSDIMDFSTDNCFDIIIVSHSFPYYKNQAQALRRLVALLKPNGTIIISNASANNLYDKICLITIKLTTGPAHYPSIQEMTSMAKTCLLDISISKVRTSWFVPTIFFLTGQIGG